MKKILLHTGLIPLTIVLAITSIAFMSRSSIQNEGALSGFTRTFLLGELVRIASIDKKGLVDVSGFANGCIFFQTGTFGTYQVYDHNLHFIKEYKVPVPNDRKMATAFITTIDENQTDIFSLNGPAIVSQGKNKNTVTHRFPKYTFTRVAKLSNNSYVFRGFTVTARGINQSIYKGNPITKEVSGLNYDSTNKGIDAGVNTDGLLCYDSLSNRLVFTSFYNNFFTCFDTSLHVTNSIKTIYNTHTGFNTDGTTVTENGKKLVSGNAGKIITGFANTYRGKLYAQSFLRADNDSEESFFTTTTVDVYDILSGKYVSTFHIPGYKMERVTRFSIKNDTLYALYKSGAASYRLPDIR